MTQLLRSDVEQKKSKKIGTLTPFFPHHNEQEKYYLFLVTNFIKRNTNLKMQIKHTIADVQRVAMRTYTIYIKSVI